MLMIPPISTAFRSPFIKSSGPWPSLTFLSDGQWPSVAMLPDRSVKRMCIPLYRLINVISNVGVEAWNGSFRSSERKGHISHFFSRLDAWVILLSVKSFCTKKRKLVHLNMILQQRHADWNVRNTGYLKLYDAFVQVLTSLHSSNISAEKSRVQQFVEAPGWWSASGHLRWDMLRSHDKNI